MEEASPTPIIPEHPVEKSVSLPKPSEKSPGIPNLDLQQESHPSTQAQITELKEHMKSSDRWMIALTFAIAFFALCSVLVGVLQWRSMNGQLKEMRDGSADTHILAKAAQTQA